MHFFSRNMRLGRRANSAFRGVMDVRYNSTTGLLEDKRGNMTPVLNQVPCAVFNGVDDRVTLDSPLIFNVNESWYIEMYIKNLVYYNYGGILGESTSNNNGLIYDALQIKLRSASGNTAYDIIINNSVNTGLLRIECDGAGGVSLDFGGNSATGTFLIDDYFEFNLIGLRNSTMFATFQCPYIDFNGEVLNLQTFSGEKVYSTDGSIIGTFSGTGSWWTRVDGIPDFLQLGAKKVTHSTGEAYVPNIISNAQIHLDYDGVTEIQEFIRRLDSNLFNFGETVDLHPTVNDEVLMYGDEILINPTMIDSDENGQADDWYLYTVFQINSIVTGNGHIGNAQRIDNNDGHMRMYLLDVFEVGKKYKLVFSYRCNKYLNLYNNLTQGLGVYDINTGDAKKVEYEFTATDSGRLWFYISNLADTWMEISNVSVKEITTISDYLDSIDEVGEDIAAQDFQNWLEYNATKDSADKFTITSTSGGIRITNLEVGKDYNLNLSGNLVLSQGQFVISNGFSTRVDLKEFNTGGDISYNDYFTAQYTELYLRFTSATVGDNFTKSVISVKEVTTIDNPFDINEIQIGELVPNELTTAPFGNVLNGYTGDKAYIMTADTQVDIPNIFINDGEFMEVFLYNSQAHGSYPLSLVTIFNNIILNGDNTLRVRVNKVSDGSSSNNTITFPSNIPVTAWFRLKVWVDGGTVYVNIYDGDTIDMTQTIVIGEACYVKLNYLGVAFEGYCMNLNYNDSSIYLFNGNTKEERSKEEAPVLDIGDNPVVPSFIDLYDFRVNKQGHSGIVGVLDGDGANVQTDLLLDYSNNFEISFYRYQENVLTRDGIFARNTTSPNQGLFFGIGSGTSTLFFIISDGVNSITCSYTIPINQFNEIKGKYYSIEKKIELILNGNIVASHTNELFDYTLIGNYFLWIGSRNKTTDPVFTKYSNVNLNNQAIYPLSGDVIDTVSKVAATNNGVTFKSINEAFKGIRLKKP